MKILGLALIMVSSSAFAATNGYELKMDLALNGKPVSSPRVLVKAGEAATINQKSETDETFIEVVATEGGIQNRKGIMMTFVIGTIGKNGERNIISKPRILAKENDPAQFIEGDESGTEKLSLSVVAKRKAL